MKVHPACELFPVDQDTINALADDIAEHGLIEPIVLHGDVLLDGRHRLRACELAEVEPDFRQWEGDEAEIVPWIIGKNLHRRHLTTSRRAMVAARLATLDHGGDRSSGKSAACSAPTQWHWLSVEDVPADVWEAVRAYVPTGLAASAAGVAP